MTVPSATLLDELKSGLAAIYGEASEGKWYLYGSNARGEQDWESDWWMCLIVLDDG